MKLRVGTLLERENAYQFCSPCTLKGPEGVKYTVCTKSTPTVIFTVTLNVANRIPSNLAHSVSDT